MRSVSNENVHKKKRLKNSKIKKVQEGIDKIQGEKFAMLRFTDAIVLLGNI